MRFLPNKIVLKMWNIRIFKLFYITLACTFTCVWNQLDKGCYHTSCVTLIARENYCYLTVTKKKKN